MNRLRRIKSLLESPMIEIVGRPKISSWMKKEERRFRKNTIDFLLKAANLELLPYNSLRKIEVLSGGDSAVVFLVTAVAGSKFVAKMARKPGVVEREAAFLQEWSKNGVRTPEVLAVHSANEALPISIASFEYISAPLLYSRKVEERIRYGDARAMGKLLAKIHLAKGHGFGASEPDNITQGTTPKFAEIALSHSMRKNILRLTEKNILTRQEFKTIEVAVEILAEDICNVTKPVLAHNDFEPRNIFNTEPLTVFDPNPIITHPALCLALTLLKSDVGAATEYSPERKEIHAGYETISGIDPRILSAAITIRGARTLVTWFRKGYERGIPKILKVIRDTGKQIA